MIQNIKVGVIALGCNKNQVDAEFIVGKLAEQFVITSCLEQADVIVISPCAFLKSARKEAINYIRKIAQYKKIGRLKCFIVTGCYAEFLKQEILNKIPEVDLVLGILSGNDISSIIGDFFNSKVKRSYISSSKFCIDINTKRIITKSPYTYIKIADGCDNKCSYCLIPTIRGKYKSRTKKSIIEEIKVLVQNSNVREINILAQDIGLYGKDLGTDLYSLLKDIVKIDKLKWVRLLYLHPRHLNEQLIDFIAEEHKICNYIDIPFQHINNKILYLMNRGIKKKDIIKKIRLLRKKIKDISIRTTFITGFPSETEEEFKELYSFIKEFKINKVGFFSYSREPHTYAYNLPNQLCWKTKNKRKNILIRKQKQISLELNAQWINKDIEVLVEKKVKDKFFKARSCYMAPEVDGYIYFKGKTELKSGDFVKVKINRVNAYDMYGIQVTM